MRHPHQSHVRRINRSLYATKLYFIGCREMPCLCRGCDCDNLYRRSVAYRKRKATIVSPPDDGLPF